ncbi:MAG TPA: TetR/AcrR family transcriptional regulator [Streptosporangiaceae bacterium]|jgi:AcrR family transcriptional regulator
MKQPMRDRILAAAVSVMRERGVTNTTTKEVARAAGVAEGSIYNHFADKTELIAASMSQVTGGMRQAVMTLFNRVGHGSLEANLTEYAETAIDFYGDLLPIVGPAMGDHQIVDWLRSGGPVQGEGPAPGPVLGNAGLIGYLEAEQRAGRLPVDANPPFLAALLLGACQQYAFLTLFTEPDAVAGLAKLPTDPATYARDVVRLLLP